ncbi:hypothetical protein BAMA_06325 [Bacillus manliponensis]|uniref:Endospore appendages core domain-containing protein n=1 Tax=Bacillus manliponensis TaxID=574376 RepID=A0A073JVD8_9BACI|nr:S-Ena type endospore appendage [Bacillus manliponensis]KEK18176.1 hypothetical protein BAMA_06325 [Bacillus manliponensis]
MTISNLTCCSYKKIVQDRICTAWSITGGEIGVQTIYSNNFSKNITASGFIKYQIGTNEITVDFFQGTTVIDSITLQPQSSGTFTVKGFTHIQIVTATGLHQGEFCMTLSYPLQ